MDTGGCGRAWGGIAYTNFEFALFVSKAGHWKAECLLQKYDDVRNKETSAAIGATRPWRNEYQRAARSAADPAAEAP